MLMDSAAIALPLGYILGRIGNFLNHELVGRETNLAIGILVGDKLVPFKSAYEAFLEGFCVFVILFLIGANFAFKANSSAFICYFIQSLDLFANFLEKRTRKWDIFMA